MRKYIGKYGHGSGGIVDETLCFKRHEYAHISFDGELPHWEQEGTLQFVTFRLKDSIPKCKIQEFAELKKEWIATHPKPWSPDDWFELTEYFEKKIEHSLSQGSGECILGIPECCDIVIKTLEFYDGKLYELYDYAVMPNHIHMVILPGYDLSIIIGRIKQYTAKRINTLLGREGHLWQRSYFDRLVRSVSNYSEIARYIKSNPFPAPEKQP